MICVVSSSVQGQGGWENVWKFLMVPSWNCLCNSFVLLDLSLRVPCLVWKSINETSDLNPPVFPGCKRGRFPSTALATAAGSHWGLQSWMKTRQHLQEMHSGGLLPALQNLALHGMGFSFDGCTTQVLTVLCGFKMCTECLQHGFSKRQIAAFSLWLSQVLGVLSVRAMAWPVRWATGCLWAPASGLRWITQVFVSLRWHLSIQL